jgi:hypothetical protein
MGNPFDFTFKKILKLARALSIVRTFAYLAGGISILVLNEAIENYIYLIVGFDVLIISALDLMREAVRRGYKVSNNHIGTALFSFIVGILILTVFHHDIYIVSVMWATVTVVNSTMEINEGLHEFHEKKSFSLINLLFAVAEITFSILLLIEPEENVEHVHTHIYLLGIGFILEATEALIGIFSPLLVKVPVVNAIPGVQKIADEKEDERKEHEEEVKAEQAEKQREKRRRERIKKLKEKNKNGA